MTSHFFLGRDISPQLTQIQVDVNYQFHKVADECITVVDIDLTSFEDAENFCLQIGARLMRIEDETAINQYLNDRNPGKAILPNTAYDLWNYK